MIWEVKPEIVMAFGRNRFLPLEVEETGVKIKKFEKCWIGNLPLQEVVILKTN